MTPAAPERAVVLPLDATRALEGLYLPGEAGAGGAVVAAPHPLFGGSMDSPVVNELAYACRGAGIASLRFNWRGVGGSAGQASGESAEADADYDAALRELAGSSGGPLLAAGYSFGAAAALRAALRHRAIARLLVVAPPVALLDAAALEAFAGRVLVIGAERDAYAPPDELRALAAGRPKVSLHVVPEADHFFGEGVSEIGRAAAQWL